MRSKKALGLFLVLPTLALLALVCFFPLVYNVELSFHSWNLAMGAPKSYVGLANYSYFISSPVFSKVLQNTFFFMALSVPLELVLGLGLALLLNREIKGRSTFLAVLCLPMLVAPVAVGLMWRWFYAMDYGLLNPLLGTLGIGAVNWLGDPSIALYSVIIADAWAMTPFMMLFCYAGLKMVPRDRYETADIDGASTWQKFRYVTLPSIKGILAIGLMIRAIDAFTRLFDVVYVLTGGGPAWASEVLPLYTYRVGLMFFRIGRGSTLAVITLLITILFISVLWKMMRR